MTDCRFSERHPHDDLADLIKAFDAFVSRANRSDEDKERLSCGLIYDYVDPDEQRAAVERHMKDWLARRKILDTREDMT